MKKLLILFVAMFLCVGAFANALFAGRSPIGITIDNAGNAFTVK